MTVAELRERLAKVPDHYDVAVDHILYRPNGDPTTCQCLAGVADVEPVRYGQHRVLAFVITAQGCP